jgi:hypothetical protein
VGIPLVDALGEQIEREWAARSYDPGSFPDICVSRLAAARLQDAVDPEEIIRWALGGVLPQQADPQATFGQPPVTLFRRRRFYVAALFWVDATTSIHDHNFAGAFQVLAGSSIETTFRFEVSRQIGEHLRCGELQVRRAALLVKGDVRPITAGPSYIHSLFHLPRPAVSLVVRSFRDVSPGIQLAYLPPGLAHDPFLVDETLDRMIQLVKLLRRTSDPGFEEQVGALIERADLHTAFAVLKSCRSMPDRGCLARLVGRVRDQEVAKLISDWLADDERITFLKSRREMVHDPDLRFILAVLLNLHRRGDALDLVRSYDPAIDAPRKVASLLRRLSEVTIRLQLAGGPWEPNLLGLPAFTPRLEEVLAAELAGQPGPLTADESAFVARLRKLPALVPLFR